MSPPASAGKDLNRAMATNALSTHLRLQQREAHDRQRAICSAVPCVLLVAYLVRCLLYLSVWAPTVASGFYISIAGSSREAHVLQWIDSQRPTFPVARSAGVVIDYVHHQRLRRSKLAPYERGQAGCRVAHLNVLRNISALRPDGSWYLVVEDDVDGSLARATSALKWLIAFVPWRVEALNLYSPTVRGWPQPLPTFNTRTTAYFVRPSGADLMIDAIERRPDLNVDQALAPIRPTLHWLRVFFARVWVVSDGLASANDELGSNSIAITDPHASRRPRRSQATQTPVDHISTRHNKSHRTVLRVAYKNASAHGGEWNRGRVAVNGHGPSASVRHRVPARPAHDGRPPRREVKQVQLAR